jgi:L-rhamnose isomerase/sugar isomerase
MQIDREQLQNSNNSSINIHKDNFNFLANQLTNKGSNVASIISKLTAFQVAIPSWALGAGIVIVDIKFKILKRELFT